MDIRLPHLAEGVDSAIVTGIFVSEGNTAKQGEALLELENEKAVAPFPSPATGTVTKIHVKEGERVTVGQMLVSLTEETGSEGATTEENAGKDESRKRISVPEEAEADGTVSRSEAERGETRAIEDIAYESKSGLAPPASPSIRKVARDLGIDLRRVRGSERGGRITLSDLRAYIQGLQEIASRSKPPQPGKGKPSPEEIDFSMWGPVERRRLSPLRRTVGVRTHDSWSSIPHVTQFDEADITSLLKLKKKYGPAYESKGAGLTLTSFVLKAVIGVLRRFPVFNSSLDESTQEIVFKQYFHLGVAVDTESGLIVPVIRDVDKKRLLELSIELKQLAEKTRQRKVAMDELRGGTFTISNQGGIGGGHFTPIINKPEVAILGLGQGVLKPVVIGKNVAVRTMLPLCLSYDHRVIDGADAARFIREVVLSLEEFKEEDLKIQAAGI
jgi:pyruvate dehydrogenase E2 component (dihydrolipoamide acetyltransferase)